MNFDSKALADSQEVGTQLAGSSRASLRRYLATSQGVLARLVRSGYRAVYSFSVPAPLVLVKPLLGLFLAMRGSWHFFLRVFVCEPLLKAYCKEYGKRLHTDCYVHWIQGKGDIVLGNDVTLDGKVSITFAVRFADHPLLKIGDGTKIGHNCDFRIGKCISLGRNCNLSSGTVIMDSNGHPADPKSRWAWLPPDPDDVRPVIIGDGVWIGLRCIIFPGVRIGEGSIVSAGSIVRTHVPPYSVVAGNPAKVMFRLKKPSAAAAIPREKEVGHEPVKKPY
jgi:acetyltransferase-like isoleucine patch superfamily enzyme